MDLNIHDERIRRILEDTFLSKYLEDDGITDIGYNGSKLWLKHNMKGRFMADVQPTEREVFNLLKNIADTMKTSLTNSDPTMNTEIGFLRVNAVHEDVSPDGRTFALRVSKPRLAVTSISDVVVGDSNDVENLLKVLIKAESNIILSGETGAGKTELQKQLVGYIPDDHKIVLIENTRDSHIKALYPEKDIISWQTLDSDERDKKITEHHLIKQGLRNDPDWILLSETLGGEAADLLDSAKTGHSIITTLHSTGAMNTPSRFIPMIRQSSSYSVMEDSLIGSEIVEFLRFGIHLEAEMTEAGIVRSIKEIVEYTDFTNKGVVGHYLYRKYNELNHVGEYEVKVETNPLSDVTLKKVEDKRLLHLLPVKFKTSLDEKEGQEVIA